MVPREQDREKQKKGFFTRRLEQKLQQHKPGAVFRGWCWPAFFLPATWYAYRKLYKESLIISLIQGLFFAATFMSILQNYQGITTDSVLAVYLLLIAVFVVQLILRVLAALFGISLYAREWDLNGRPPHKAHKTFWGAIGFLILGLPLGHSLFSLLAN